MAIWPFKRRKRSSATSITPNSKRPATTDNSENTNPHGQQRYLRLRPETPPTPSAPQNPTRRSSIRRTFSRRKPHQDAIVQSSQPANYISPYDPVSDSPLHEIEEIPSSTAGLHIRNLQLPSPASSPNHHNNTDTKQDFDQRSLSGSSHRHHKRPSILRRLSKLKAQKPKQHQPQPPPSAYEAKLRGRPLPGRENDRPISLCSTAPRTSLDSNMSSRAYKIHPLDVFSPHPTLHIDDSATSSPGANGLSRSNSRQTSFRTAQGWKFREPLTNKDANSGHRARVDDLADELDAKGLREAMERDQRRKDRKKREYEEKLQMKLEQRALDQLRFEAEPESDVGETYQNGENEQQYQRGESSRSAQQLDPETQTPLSWFNVDSSRENVDNEASEYAPRTGAVTPVSMDDSIEDDYEEAQRQSHLAEWVEKTVPAVMVESGSPPATTRAKTSAWTSFIKRATAARIKKDNASRGIPNRDSTGSEASVLRSQPNAGPYLDVEDLRHREGQTPGRHVAKEVVVAMNALASGHIQEKGYEDEMRDSVCPTPPIMIPYHLNGSQVSSRSSLNPQGPGLRGGATTKNSSPFDDTRDSPTIPQYHHPRPPSAQRYSPSMRYSSGGVSPEIGGARSIIAGSLASIDSEGSWLSGKVKPRQSMQHLSPLRTSASSLRKRYQDLDDNDVNMDDEYFSGVKSDKQVAGRDSRGGILDPDDSDDDDAVSINSETERNMWRKGMEQRVHMERGTKTMSRHGLLGILQTSDGDSPQLIDGDEYATPLEHPLERTISNNSDFKTPSEQQINYQVW